MKKLHRLTAGIAAAVLSLVPFAGTNAAAGIVAAAQKSDVTGDYAPMERWRTTTRDEGGTLLFSDSPEYVKEDGILYQDTVQGKARVLFYHLNDSATDKKVAVLLEREGISPAKVTITRGASAKPGRDFLRVGRMTQRAYFGDSRSEELRVTPGSPMLLQGDMGKKILRPGDLVYGVYDFETNRPLKVTVLIHDAAVDAKDFLPKAKVLPKDEYKLRGTFKGMNRVITAVKSYDGTKEGVRYIPIGDNERDLYREGIDATDGEKALNYGNYGILYQIKLPIAERKSAQIGLTPLGGVYSGAVKVLPKSDGKGKVIPTPKTGGYFGDRALPAAISQLVNEKTVGDGTIFTKYHEYAPLGVYRSKELLIEYSPPGASNLPVWLVLSPKD